VYIGVRKVTAGGYNRRREVVSCHRRDGRKGMTSDGITYRGNRKSNRLSFGWTVSDSSNGGHHPY